MIQRRRGLIRVTYPNGRRVIVPVGTPFFGPNRVTPGRGLRPSTAA